MAIGWLVNVAEADTYFSTQRLETEAWDGLVVDSTVNEKEKVLYTAYNRLKYCDEYKDNIPASPTAEQLAVLKLAQEEMAYYYAQHLSDEDRRKGLQAQAVKKAGIVKEDYEKDMLKEMPIPPFVRELMKPFEKSDHFFATDIARDEDESVDENVTDY